MPNSRLAVASGSATAVVEAVPEYLAKTYTWAYLSRRNVAWLDRPAVVSAILWGNANRLMRESVAEFQRGERVLQAACVYGRYSAMLAHRLGHAGELTITDVATVQLENAAAKLRGCPRVRLHRGDLARGQPGVPLGSVDAVACFFPVARGSGHRTAADRGDLVRRGAGRRAGRIYRLSPHGALASLTADHACRFQTPRALRDFPVKSGS